MDEISRIMSTDSALSALNSSAPPIKNQNNYSELN